MNKESKLNLDAGDYAIRHCIIDQTYNGLEVHKMLCDAYIAGNNDTLEDDDERIRKGIFKALSKKDARDVLISQDVEVSEALAWLERQGTKLPVGFYYVNSDGKKFYSDTLKYGDVILHVENQSKQKREWSEEDDDDAWMNDIICKVENNLQLNKAEIDWLKSIKERMGG